jgi:uncharacterized membrane protein
MTNMQWLARSKPWLALTTAFGCGNDGRTPVRLSTFVMRALSEPSPAAGMEAMQRINAEIVIPTFLLLFLGTRVIAVLTTIVPLKVGSGRSYVIAGTACYLAGVLGVSMLCNVPMNNRLARLAAGARPIIGLTI